MTFGVYGEMLHGCRHLPTGESLTVDVSDLADSYFFAVPPGERTQCCPEDERRSLLLSSREGGRGVGCNASTRDVGRLDLCNAAADSDCKAQSLLLREIIK
ncbi:hypothetical protein B296_00008113 [Ensete ventricosum]|uniref:Uncharacterized protein n=1 Tax=Ensete ventricosum TaxID=4639 RepID=A0A427AMY5_ENSVE|nr:hypothetical protein B296_00008113 [Ensete ventricosum]